jgi:hypothetical protein
VGRDHRTPQVDPAFGRESALGLAARQGHLEVVNVLLKARARVDALHFLHGPPSPGARRCRESCWMNVRHAHAALRHGHEPVVDALAGMGAGSTGRAAMTAAIEEAAARCGNPLARSVATCHGSPSSHPPPFWRLPSLPCPGRHRVSAGGRRHSRPRRSRSLLSGGRRSRRRPAMWTSAAPA